MTLYHSGGALLHIPRVDKSYSILAKTSFILTLYNTYTIQRSLCLKSRAILVICYYSAQLALLFWKLLFLKRSFSSFYPEPFVPGPITIQPINYFLLLLTFGTPGQGF